MSIIDHTELLDIQDDVLVPRPDHPLFPVFCPKPTVRILFYTDDPSVRINAGPDFGVKLLHDLLLTHNTFHAIFDIDLVDRHDGGHGANKLTPALLNQYDQVWFFGVQQCNRPGMTPPQMEHELTDAEVDALTDWMGSGRRGGVLITGDHSNARPFGADPALDPLVNLGRALGHRIPRAGRLRVWEGLPSANFAQMTDTHDTQEPDGLGTDLNNLTLQDDAIPQQLQLVTFPVGFPLLFFHRRPHPLFCGRSGPIRVFPDHMHEGALVIPSAFPAGEWPSGPLGQPTPQVVARGTDKRFAGGVYDLVSAYDGDRAAVARIVADSTWHHYFNVNLRGFPQGSPTLDSIADYYVNLAVWLSPPGRRWQMACWFWWYISVHPAVRMVAGGPFQVIGRTAYDVLGRRASQCFINDLVFPFPREVKEIERLPWPPEEVMLGGIVDAFHRGFTEVQAGQPLPATDDLIRQGTEAAVEQHVTDLRRTADAAGELADRVIEGLQYAIENAQG